MIVPTGLERPFESLEPVGRRSSSETSQRDDIILDSRRRDFGRGPIKVRESRTRIETRSRVRQRKEYATTRGVMHGMRVTYGVRRASTVHPSCARERLKVKECRAC